MSSGRLAVESCFLPFVSEGAGVVMTDGDYQIVLSADEAERFAAMLTRSVASVRVMKAAVLAYPAVLNALATTGVGRA